MINKEIIQTDEQIILSIISIGTVIVSIILLLNDKEKQLKRPGFINRKDEYNIALYNRIVLFIIFFLFLIINYNIYKEVKEKGKEDSTPYLLQVYASLLTFISTIIVLYITIKSSSNKQVDLENPTI